MPRPGTVELVDDRLQTGCADASPPLSAVSAAGQLDGFRFSLEMIKVAGALGCSARPRTRAVSGRRR
jgi:hypothetical protein